MKTTAFKTKKRTILTTKLRAGQNRKPTKRSRVFRFAPDAVGIMSGPADLSMREGLSE